MCSMTCWAPRRRCGAAKDRSDVRRRRLTALINATSLDAKSPAVYIVEDAHWIDEVSEAMLADFLVRASQRPSLVLITYRPEYRGSSSRWPVLRP